MKKKLFRSAFMALTALAFTANVFVACSDDDKKADPANKAALEALITECDALVETSSPTTHDQEDIDAFNKTLDLAKAVVAIEDVAQLGVDNAVSQLTEAKATFVEATYQEISATNILIGLDFDEGSDGIPSLIAAGKGLTATLEAGPVEIFGAATNQPSFIAGKQGQAIYFNNGSHLEINGYAPADFEGKTLSIAVWVKIDSTRPGNYIISYNYWNSWKFQVQENNKPFFTVSTSAGGVDADNQQDNSVLKQEWTHLVASLDLNAGTLSIYVNGKFTIKWDKTTKPNLTGSIKSYANSLPIFIGACTNYAEAKDVWEWEWEEAPNAWDHFVGAMDELKVYNTALNAGQVRKLYKDEN